MSSITNPTIKTVIVFGASGQQGSGFIQALSAHNTPSALVRYRILALSRDITASSMNKIKGLPGVELVGVRQDCMDKPAEAFEEAAIEKGKVDVVFACQGYVSEKVDLAQGLAMANAAHAWGCRHFNLSSAPLGPLSEAEAEGTFIGMRLPVEKHIKSLKSMNYTFLRPTQFMENLLPISPYMFKLTRTILLRYTFYTHPERKHQMISVRDIGRTGALAVTSVGTAKQDKYLNQAVELAGDEYTMQELREKYRKVMGEEITECWNPLAYGLAKGFPLLRDMSRWWDRYGFCADINGLREEMPEFEDLTMFLKRYKAEQARQ